MHLHQAFTAEHGQTLNIDQPVKLKYVDLIF